MNCMDCINCMSNLFTLKTMTCSWIVGATTEGSGVAPDGSAQSQEGFTGAYCSWQGAAETVPLEAAAPRKAWRDRQEAA